jgi:membrane protease YdiL (CAAX protease family)
MKQIGIWFTLGIWALLSLSGILFALWQGYTGRAFAAAATTLSLLLLPMLLFAARGFADRFSASLGSGSNLLLAVSVFVLYVIYLFGTGTFALARIGIVAALIFVPLALAMSAAQSAPGSWQDFLTLAAVWVFVKFGPSHYLWPYPGGRLAYISTVLVAVNVAIATFLLARRTKGIGYSIGWRNNWALYVLGSFLIFGCIAIPLGISMHFISFAPQWNQWGSFLGLSIAILIFTAWPEEFLFRGLLQNLLARSSKSEIAGWWTSSVLFGLSHITNNGHFPNWRYVILATIAGLFYAYTWRRTNSIFASALVHAAVDITWHFFFRTL